MFYWKCVDIAKNGSKMQWNLRGPGFPAVLWGPITVPLSLSLHGGLSGTVRAILKTIQFSRFVNKRLPFQNAAEFIVHVCSILLRTKLPTHLLHELWTIFVFMTSYDHLLSSHAPISGRFFVWIVHVLTSFFSKQGRVRCHIFVSKTIWCDRCVGNFVFYPYPQIWTMNSAAFWNGGRLFQEGEIRSCLCIAGSVADSACMNAGSLQLPELVAN